MAGSIEKRGKNSWRLVVSAGLDQEGRQIKKTKNVTVKVDCPQTSCKGCAKMTRCRVRKEAEQALAEFALEIEKGMFVAPSKLTFQEFAERWLRDYGETNLA
jgi:integrase